MFLTTVRILDSKPCDTDDKRAFHIQYQWGAVPAYWTCVTDCDNVWHAANRFINQKCREKGVERKNVDIVLADGWDEAFTAQPETAVDETAEQEQVMREKFVQTIEQLIDKARQEEIEKAARDLQALREVLRTAGRRAIQTARRDAYRTGREDQFNEQARYGLRVQYGFPGYPLNESVGLYRNPLVALTKAADLMQSLLAADFDVQEVIVRDHVEERACATIYPDGSLKISAREPILDYDGYEGDDDEPVFEPDYEGDDDFEPDSDGYDY